VVESDNGLNGGLVFLNNNDSLARPFFPQYPNPAVSCSIRAVVCSPPAELNRFVRRDLSAFSSDFQIPKVDQASLNLEREIAHRFAVGASYMYVHGENLIRARDVNLPQPVTISYPIFDTSGANFLGSYNVESFSTLQFTRSLECVFPPCINPLARPIPQLGAIDVFESAASSVYHGGTLSVRRRMNKGVYFRLAYTFARAIDDGQDALVTGRPATVQNPFLPSAERGLSVTDQRHRLALSWVVEPRPFDRGHDWLGHVFNDWKVSAITTAGSGRPVNATVTGDPNQDGNDSNDRLPGVRRNSFVGPNYATTDVRLSRRLYLGDRFKLELIGESFNILNRDNRRVLSTDDGFQSNSAQFVQSDKLLSNRHFPGYYRVPTNFLHARDAYAPRQVQLALRLVF
jgi:hypothetical protein